MIPLPEPVNFSDVQLPGNDEFNRKFAVWGYTADQLRAYGDAVRADERERAAQICTAAMPQPVTNWCDAQIVEALRQCAEAIRNYRAQDNVRGNAHLTAAQEVEDGRE